MNKIKAKIKRKESMSITEIINFGLTILSLIISTIIAMAIFVLPLLKTKLIIDNPTIVYTVSKENESFDEVIIPVITTNYGNYIRSVNKIEATIDMAGNFIPIKPLYVYDSLLENLNDSSKTFYSSFSIPVNGVSEKYIGFVFDATNFSQIDKIPSEFHFEKNSLYTIYVRFYTKRNSFFGGDEEVIQVICAFETRDEIQKGFILNPSKQCWFEEIDRNITKRPDKKTKTIKFKK